MYAQGAHIMAHVTLRKYLLSINRVFLYTKKNCNAIHAVFQIYPLILLKLFYNLMKLIISVKNVPTRVEQMMVVVQVDLVSAAHVSF